MTRLVESCFFIQNSKPSLLMALVGSDVRQDGHLFLGLSQKKGVKSFIKRFRSEAEGVLER